MFQTDDTIAAISTAAGSGRRAIVRLSGPAAVDVASLVFTPTSGVLSDLGGFRSADGLLSIPCSPRGANESAGANSEALCLPARAYVFRTPRSYTRQDVVELHIPGPAVVATATLDALIAAGARAAEAGEFTARAFFSGRIDLSAAEAVADMIHAADAAQLRSATAALGGVISRFCKSAAGEVADVLATVEASIDLADEAIELDSPADLAGRLAATGERLREFAARASDMPETGHLPRAVIVGRPNVGKSSLLNALTGTNRAIVSALAGTTRDVLSAEMDLPGGPVLLQDAAGIAGATDGLPALADEAARSAVAAADAVVFVFDAAEAGGLTMSPDDERLLEQVREINPSCGLMVIANKVDALQAHASTDTGCRGRGVCDHVFTTLQVNLAANSAATAPLYPDDIGVSAKTGAGVAELKTALATMLRLDVSRSSESLGLHQRQRRSLLAASAGCEAAEKLLSPAGAVVDVAELAAIELRAALDELGHISGLVVTEDILGRIFRRFCVGK